MKDYQYHIFSPYRVCPLGAHVDHQHGLVTGFAIDKGVDLYFDVRSKMADGRCDSHVHLENQTFEGMVDFDIATPTLVNRVIGVITPEVQNSHCKRDLSCRQASQELLKGHCQ